MAEESEAEALVQTCRRCGDSSPVREGFDRRGHCFRCRILAWRRIQWIRWLAPLPQVLLAIGMYWTYSRLVYVGERSPSHVIGFLLLAGLCLWASAILHLLFQVFGVCVARARLQHIALGSGVFVYEWAIQGFRIALGSSQISAGGVIYAFPRNPRRVQLLIIPMAIISGHLIAAVCGFILVDRHSGFYEGATPFLLGSWNLVGFLWHAIPHVAVLTWWRNLSQGSEIFWIMHPIGYRKLEYNNLGQRMSVLSPLEKGALHEQLLSQGKRESLEESEQRAFDLFALGAFQQIVQEFECVADALSPLDASGRTLLAMGVPDSGQAIIESVAASRRQLYGEEDVANWLASVLLRTDDPVRRARFLMMRAWSLIVMDRPDPKAALDCAQSAFDVLPWLSRYRGQLGIALIENGRDAEGLQLLKEADEVMFAELDIEGVALRRLWRAFSLARLELLKEQTQEEDVSQVLKAQNSVSPKEQLDMAARVLSSGHPQVLWMRKRIDELTG